MARYRYISYSATTMTSGPTVLVLLPAALAVHMATLCYYYYWQCYCIVGGCGGVPGAGG